MQAAGFWKYFYEFVGVSLVLVYTCFAFVPFAIQDTSETPVKPPVKNVLSAASISFESASGLPDTNAILDAVNKHRTGHGLGALKPSATLERLAKVRAQDMAGSNYYAHQDKRELYYYDYLPSVGLKRTTHSCENLNLQFEVSTKTYLASWLESEDGHRECVLDPKVNAAGYAAVSMGELDNGKNTFIVVAIHAALPAER